MDLDLNKELSEEEMFFNKSDINHINGKPSKGEEKYIREEQVNLKKLTY